MRPSSAIGRWRGRHALRGATILALSALVSACTALPEGLDPGTWFQDEPEEPTRISAAQDTEAAQKGDFPNLASVPDEPRAATSSVERGEIAKGLAADRSNAQYSGQRLVGDDGAQGAPAGAPAQPPIAGAVAATAAAPAPTPSLAPTRTDQAPAAKAPAPIAPSVPRAQVAATPQPVRVAPPQFAGRSELAGIIYFAHGSAGLSGDDRAVLRDVAALHRQRGGSIRVVGHASARTGTVDPVEHRLANLEVSQQRADSVAAALMRMGVTRGKVVTEARADAQPVYHEFMPTGEAGNRRAEIFLEK